MLIIIFTCEQMNILYYLDLTEKKMGGITSIRLQRQRSTVSEWKPIFPQTAQGTCPDQSVVPVTRPCTLAGRHRTLHTQGATCTQAHTDLLSHLREITRDTRRKSALCLWESSKTLWNTWREMILTKEQKIETWKWTEVLKRVGIEKAFSKRSREERANSKRPE